MRLSIGIAAGVLLVATPGCREPAGFACSTDEQCMRLDGDTGRCFPVSACGYVDPDCASGYRYSVHAPDPWANECVVPTTPPVTTIADSSSGGDSGEGSTSTSSGPSATTEHPQPQCGNGDVEGDELCDDGDDIEGNGCNPDCRPSGTQLLSFTSQLEGRDQAQSVMLTDDGVVVGGIAGESPDRDGFVARYRTDGVEVWRHELMGSAELVDAVYQVQPSPSGSVRALGQVINLVADKKLTPREDFWLADFDVETGSPNWAFIRGEIAPDAERGYGLAILPEGDMLVAGRLGASTNSDFGITRFSPITDKKGGFQLETVWSHAIDGGVDARDFANAVVWDPSGRVVVGGGLEAVEGDIDRHLRALDENGSPLQPPCEDFGGDDPLGTDDRIHALAVGPSGEVVAAGRATRETEEGLDAWIGYYMPGTCTLAWVDTEPGAGQGNDVFTAVAIDERGNIVAGGFLNTGNTEDAWLVKYDPTGERLWSIEPIDGSGNGADRIQSLVIGPDREITVAGRLTRPGDDDVWVARYTP